MARSSAIMASDSRLAFSTMRLASSFAFRMDFFTLIFELFPLCFRLIADGDHLVARLLGQFALLLGHLTVIFGVGNHVLKANLLFGKQLLRPAMINSGRPSFREISNALDFPGIPMDRRYVGLSVATSNSTEAFSTFGVVSAYSFSSL